MANLSIDSGLSWLGTMLKYVKEYGFFNIVKACVLLLLVVVTTTICINPGVLIDRYNKLQSDRHNTERIARSENDSKVQKLMPSILEDTKASRVWVIQYHNGISDWSFGAMRFESCAKGVESIRWHYNDFHLSWLVLPGYLEENRFYIGTVEDLKDIDCSLHDMLERRGVKYLATILIKKVDAEDSLGILGFTWEEIPDLSIEQIRAKLNRYSGTLEQLLPPQVKF